VDSSYLAVGGSTTLSSAFGVDAGDVTSFSCVVVSGKPRCSPVLTTPAPIFTQYYSGEVSYQGKAIAVGSEPVAVRLYGAHTSSTTVGGTTATTTGPANAIVANSGSSSVSVVSLSTNTDLKNIAVGPQPMALTLNSASTMAYVASYGNGSLAEVDLSTEAVTRTLSGLAGALSVAMDPSGSYVWVGGTNNIYKVNLSTFAVAVSVPVSGIVTSLAMSNAQNELVYTVVQGCCTGSSTYAANELLVSNLSQPGTYAHATASPYAAYTMNGTLPTAAVLPQATNVVSTKFSNGMGASSTPTGFVIYDLIGHQQIMTGTTPTPVRGIASDPDCMFAYFTLPDSNEYIAVPLESAP
jgi:YVTN family beta-propeller protein